MVVSSPAGADPIEFRFSGVGTGVAGDRPFANAPFTITAVGDTDNIVDVPAIGFGGTVYSVPAPASIDITGIGSGRITTNTRVFQNDRGGATGSTPTLGLSRLPHDLGQDLLDLADPSVSAYRLRTSIGPILEPDPQAFSQFTGVGSDLGTLSFSDVDFFTFEAVVPEPAGPLVLAAAAWALRRRRR
jgi:hypothetical protein